MAHLDESAVQRLAEVWQQFVDQGRIVGGVVLLAEHGTLRYACARGWADRERQLPVSRDTRFRLASLTKLLTSVTVMRLCELGVASLDAAVSDWLPTFRPTLADGREPVISLRHLLSHTSGLSYGFEQPPGNAYHQAGVSDGLDGVAFDLQENLTRLARVPLLFEPGSAWGYSLATDVLGAVIEQASGLRLSEAVARWVTEPLRMGRTSFSHASSQPLAAAYKDCARGPQRIGDNDAVMLDSGQARLSPARAFDLTAYESGGAGMLGTADDYLRLLECLRLGGAPLLSPASTRLLLSNAMGQRTVENRGPGWKFGLGPMILTDPLAAGQRQGAGTWSWCGVYGSHYWVDPVSAISLVAVTNTAVAGAWGEFAEALVDALYLRPGQTACGSCSD
ncbi:serine hydrolase domain-containing protein [Pseudomonas cannabina]|uniref:Serine hydrolase n=3 Tax=Pseudomonas syringae group TaxID=136849 RepID=A0A8T8C1T9_PSEYM|nr:MULTISPECIES: serine hydrolase domain-containing protein [Pseudomonas syringae group]KPB71424.1 Beta-lactamase [Pseudomonas syringae pv. maculicola]KPW23659.1 Beta-lactamase [Pseudomonas cannabina pv. alisalensis]MBM0138182.1 beta-lactamase family protein [Pseudomonas cannabina pv. alisalensis]QHE97356.1 serine hydrolase [Pseudomonas syringae pv. maculicola str. ES4326]QQN24390.1 beta-lactamase family protein [Pseudomonas cannabina pv. alisalensis]